jgi:hypothetical protein
LHLLAHGWEPTLAKYKPKGVASNAAADENPAVTVGLFLAEVMRTTTNRSTVEAYAKAFRQIVSDIFGFSDSVLPPAQRIRNFGFCLEALQNLFRIPLTGYCRAFLAGRRGAKDPPEALGAARRDGALKMGWTKPPRGCAPLWGLIGVTKEPERLKRAERGTRAGPPG